MTQPRRIPITLTFLLVCSLLLAACKPAAPAATSTPTPTVTFTPSPTATATLFPTATATLQPTPIPAGYHALDWAGFSFIVPESWELLEDDPMLMVFSDPKDRTFYLVVTCDYIDETSSIDSMMEEIMELLGAKKLGKFTHTKPVDVDVPGSKDAQMVEFRLKTDFAITIFRTYIIESAQRRVMMVFSGQENTLDRKKLTLERVIGSIEMTLPRPFGLDRAETFYQLSGEPEPKELDPAVSTSSAEDYTGLLFSGLVRLTPGMQIEPDLSESWEISNDGATYTFTLREGVQFADGTPITAQDVADSWERATDPELDSTTARTYLGDIQGVQEKLDGDAETISGLEVIDRATLKVTLLGPRPYFLAKLTYPTAMVVDTRFASTTDEAWVWTANASGPFTIKEHIEGEALIFERNDSYHHPASVRYLLYSFIWGGSPKSLFEDGELDLLPIPYDDVLQVKKEDDPSHDQLVSTPSMCTSLLQLNTARQPTDDPKVREALALAIDRDELNESILSGLSMAAGTILPPAMPGFSADLDEVRFDPEAARQALQESAYAGKPITIKITIAGYAGDESPMVSAVANMWKQTLGINVQIENLDPSDFERAARENPGNVVSYGWCADYPDPENFLDLLFHTGNDFNVTAYSNAEIDALLEQARIEPDPQKRLALYRQVEERLLAEYVSIPLFHSISHYLIHSRVQNYIAPSLGVQQMQNVSLKP